MNAKYGTFIRTIIIAFAGAVVLVLAVFLWIVSMTNKWHLQPVLQSIRSTKTIITTMSSQQCEELFSEYTKEIPMWASVIDYSDSIPPEIKDIYRGRFTIESLYSKVLDTNANFRWIEKLSYPYLISKFYHEWLADTVYMCNGSNSTKLFWKRGSDVHLVRYEINRNLIKTTASRIPGSPATHNESTLPSQ